MLVSDHSHFYSRRFERFWVWLHLHPDLFWPIYRFQESGVPLVLRPKIENMMCGWSIEFFSTWLRFVPWRIPSFQDFFLPIIFIYILCGAINGDDKPVQAFRILQYLCIFIIQEMPVCRSDGINFFLSVFDHLQEAWLMYGSLENRRSNTSIGGRADLQFF